LCVWAIAVIFEITAITLTNIQLLTFHGSAILIIS